mmetsp:Transcript_33375/g.99391  ORF Transcript_33375/g.99391 Transcript_33375/m.99391 type:complete len:328 (+) Transcript_33375:1044-2027(+)
MQSLRRRAFFRSPNIPASALCPTCASMLSSLAAVVPVDGHLRDSGVASTSGRSETGSLSMLRSIVRKEGLHALWRGVDTAMAHSIPMNGIYMPLYDYLQGAMRPTTGALSPALAGMAARGVAVSMTAPIELIRTRQQAAAGAMTWRAALAGAAPGSALFTGLSASLARDVPFTALYWCAVEPIREALLPPTGRDANGQRVPPASVAHVFWANVAAGSVSGAFAAALTTPLDVVKTRMQTAVATGGSPGDAVCFAARPTGPLGTLRRIWQLEGPAALLSGIGPRVARAVPACAIVISTYEVAKTALRSPPPVDDAWWESSHQTVSVDE